MIRKFSVHYNMEKNKRKKELEGSGKLEMSLRKSILHAKENNSVLNEDVAEYILNLSILYYFI
jgi:hypothetical protein